MSHFVNYCLQYTLILSGKSGNVLEFDGCEGNVMKLAGSCGNIGNLGKYIGKLLSGKTVYC